MHCRLAVRNTKARGGGGHVSYVWKTETLLVYLILTQQSNEWFVNLHHVVIVVNFHHELQPKQQLTDTNVPVQIYSRFKSISTHKDMIFKPQTNLLQSSPFSPEIAQRRLSSRQITIQIAPYTPVKKYKNL